HGRLYTGKFGHQSLSKIERKTICIDGGPTVELDYGGLHPRLLYHLGGIDYQDDPYALWGEQTTKPMRTLTKTLINALINAPTPQEAIAACNYRTCLYTSERAPNGRRILKQGKRLKQAKALADALRTTNLRFRDIEPVARQYHQRIAHQFGCDMGI